MRKRIQEKSVQRGEFIVLDLGVTFFTFEIDMSVKPRTYFAHAEQNRTFKFKNFSQKIKCFFIMLNS